MLNNMCMKAQGNTACRMSRINIVLNRSTLPPASFNAPIPLDTLNHFFQTVAITPLHWLVQCFVLPNDDHGGAGFSFNDISIDTVFQHLSTLDVRKSAGSDGLSALF